MSRFWMKQNETNVNIPSFEEISGVIYYNIQVSVSDVKWLTLHRYSEFFELHSQLVVDHGVPKDILPCKKVLRSKSPEFVENRRQGLQKYLQRVLNFLKLTMPRIFAEFLSFQMYDVFFLLQTLAFKFYSQADELLASSNSYTFSVLDVHSISRCCNTPAPSENVDRRYDFTHVLDFCSQLKILTVEGSPITYKKSNIIPNELPFDFKSFKSVSTLILNEASLEYIVDVGNLRSNLMNLSVHKTKMVSICQILQCDVIHKCNFNNDQVWSKLTLMDLSNNNLTEIDESICLVPSLQVLILNENKISSIPDLSHLPNLTSVSLCGNLIKMCLNLHTKLGNILSLNLSQNSITSLDGFLKLYSLETLDLSSNQIVDIEEIKYLSDLPNLENLVLTGNNVSTIIDYRIKVLENFGNRAKEMCLDNEKPLQPELDKVSILRALRIVKEGKTPDIMNNIM